MASGLYINSLGQSKFLLNTWRHVQAKFLIHSYNFRMFDTILTNDPSNWPWSAYINLPLLPISLAFSRFQASSLLIPLLLIWPPASSGPVGEQGRRLFEYWSKPENASRLSQMKFIPTHSWPPPPLILGIIGLPVIRVFYHRFYAHLYLKCMGTPLPPPRRIRGMDFNEGGPFVIRIRADGQEQGPGVELQQQQQQQQQPQAGAAGEDQDPNAAAAEAAEQLIEINAASLGRRIGGALMIPAISSFMGNLLFRLSKHSGILRSFLGIRPQRVSWADYTLPPWGLHSRLGLIAMDKGWDDLNPYQKAKMGVQLFFNAFSSGSRTFVDSDPVWCVFLPFFYFYFFIGGSDSWNRHRWRNAVGFGLFFVVCFLLRSSFCEPLVICSR